MTAQIYDFSKFLNARIKAARGIYMTFTVSIEPENIRSGMRLLSRLFPEMSNLESDASVLFTRADFNKAANPVTGAIQYGAPFKMTEKMLSVKLSGNEDEAGEQPLFAITSTKPENGDPMILPTTWGEGGPYIVVSDLMIISEPKLLAVLKEYSAGQQSPQNEPLRSKIARAVGAKLSCGDDGRTMQIPTITVTSAPMEMRIR